MLFKKNKLWVVTLENHRNTKKEHNLFLAARSGLVTPVHTTIRNQPWAHGFAAAGLGDARASTTSPLASGRPRKLPQTLKTRDVTHTLVPTPYDRYAVHLRLELKNRGPKTKPVIISTEYTNINH